MAGPYLPIEPTPVTPPVYSLVKAARTPPPGESSDWVSGIAYTPDACDNSGIFDPCDVGTLPGDWPDESGRPAEVKFDPFGVYAFARCTTAGTRLRGLKDEAKSNLLATESKQIARELWNGTYAIAGGRPNMYLTKAGASEIGDASGLDPQDALACLVQALRECGSGGRGMIHATAQVVALWQHLNMIDTDGQIAYVESSGDLVVGDAGYSGLPPAGVADSSGVSWAFATDMVTVRRSEITVWPDTLTQATRRTHNDVVFRAQRTVAATFDGCCRAAVGVQVTPCVGLVYGS